MSLYDAWKNLSETHENQEAEIEFWKDYLNVERDIYRKILEEKTETVEGKVADLAAKYETSPEYFMGFIDGISESLKEDLDLDAIEADGEVAIKIDWEKLFYNMCAVEAEWLYTLPEWDGILSAETRKELHKKYKKSKTIVKEHKVGRNDPCPCGSGKKYKKCCGKNA